MLLIFGLGYTAGRIAAAWPGVTMGTTRDGRDGTLRFDDAAAVRPAIAAATHILSSVPPEGDVDPVLARYGDALDGRWLGYLSSTGIYGPGRSPLERVRAGRAHRVGLPDQVFSRVHVDDIVAGVFAALNAPAGAYNLADDLPCAQDDVVAYAAQLLRLPPPPLVDIATLSPMARGFYAENRRVANGKAKRVLGWRPAWPTYRLGLRALNAMTSPMPASAPPAAASGDQR